MADYGTLTLDTSPPTGVLTRLEAVAGGVCEVGYELDEIGITGAELLLNDTDVLSMVVAGSSTSGVVVVDLPGDAPRSGLVTVYVEDALDNAGSLELAIAIDYTGGRQAGVIPDLLPATPDPSRGGRALVRL